jgi:hypothetical protein
MTAKYKDKKTKLSFRAGSGSVEPLEPTLNYGYVMDRKEYAGNGGTSLAEARKTIYNKRSVNRESKP